MDLNERVFDGELDLKSNSAKEEIHQVITHNITAGIVHTGSGTIEASNATIAAIIEQSPSADVIARLTSLADEIERVAKDADKEFDDIARELIDIRTELSKPQPNSSFLKTSFKALTWGGDCFL